MEKESPIDSIEKWDLLYRIGFFVFNLKGILYFEEICYYHVVDTFCGFDFFL